MLNYSDVQQLRAQGQTNRQILEMMAPVVPSARNALNAIDADKTTPQWQVETKIGQMLDKQVPKNAPSGLAYLSAVGLNRAQRSFDQKMTPPPAPVAPPNNAAQGGNMLLGALSGIVGGGAGKSVQDAPQAGYLSGVAQGIGNDIQQATSGMNESLSDFRSGRQGLLSTELQVTGHLAGGAANALSEPVKPITEPIIGALYDSIQKNPGLLGPIMDFLAQKQNEFAVAHPEAAKNLNAVGQIASLPAAMEGASQGIQSVGSGLETLGKGTVDTAKNAIQAGKGGLQDLKTGATKVVNKALGVNPEEIAKTKAANEAYLQELNRAKTAEDISVPARSTANDIIAAKKKTAIIKDGKIIGYKPNEDVATTLKQVVTDPNNIPQSLGEIQDAKATLSDQARAELTKQGAGKIHEFQTARYQNAAIKDLRTVLSDAMETPENQLHFVDDKEMAIQQKIASQLEQRYKANLAATGEKEIAKLDLRQWIDKQIPDVAFSKDLAELPPNTRSLVTFRRALSDSIDENAAKIGGSYGKQMKQISNLYKAEETVATHMPKPENLMQRYNVSGDINLPNVVPPTAGEVAKKAVKGVAKRALLGTELGLGLRSVGISP